jgi:homogentisate 1,2-dioxygenase
MFEAKREATDEYAVMLDAREALEIGEAAGAVENEAYVHSWRAHAEPAPTPRIPAGD